MSLNWGDIVEDILEHIEDCTRRKISSYQVGRSNDPKRELFFKQNVNEKKGCWVYRKAQSLNDAKIAEQELIEMGMKGKLQPENSTDLSVYCFEITEHTLR